MILPITSIDLKCSTLHAMLLIIIVIVLLNSFLVTSHFTAELKITAQLQTTKHHL